MKQTLLTITIISSLFLFLLNGCGGDKKKPAKVPEYRRPPAAKPVEEKTAENQAALALIANGKKALQEGDLKSAEWYFEEALRIAPSHGPAYYWLARSKVKKGDTDRALNLLDRAELLLKRTSSWLEKINQLRQKILSGEVTAHSNPSSV